MRVRGAPCMRSLCPSACCANQLGCWPAARRTCPAPPGVCQNHPSPRAPLRPNPPLSQEDSAKAEGAEQYKKDKGLE